MVAEQRLLREVSVQHRGHRRAADVLRGPGRKYGSPVSGWSQRWCPELECWTTHRRVGRVRAGRRGVDAEVEAGDAAP